MSSLMLRETIAARLPGEFVVTHPEEGHWETGLIPGGLAAGPVLRTNLAPDPYGLDLANFRPDGGTLTHSAGRIAVAVVNTSLIVIRRTAVSTSAADEGFPAVAGDRVTVSVTGTRGGGSVPYVRLRTILTPYRANNTAMSVLTGAALDLATTAARRAWVATMPADTAYVHVQINVIRPTGYAPTAYLEEFAVEIGSTAPADPVDATFFAGDFPDDTAVPGVQYDWVGPANLSPSTMRELIELPPHEGLPVWVVDHPEEVEELAGIELDVVDYRIRLDESRTPYVEAELTCSAPKPGVFQVIDPRDRLRLEVDLTRERLDTGAIQERSFDLVLHARELDAGAATVTLTGRSDEAALFDDILGGTVVDDSAEAHQGSLRDIIDNLLTAFDAELAPGDADADFTITDPVRDADTLKREPGERAWDFLSSLVEAAGLRLFCDEQRVWRLVDPATYALEGSVRIAAAHNATAARDRIDLAEASTGPGFAETIVVRYRWTDSLGVQQTVYEAAGAPHGIGRLIEVTRPYPGPGAAQSALRRAEGKGRTLDPEALTDLTATPGMTVVATIPGTPTQVGIVSSVEFRSDGTMQVGTRGIVDTPDTAWLFAEGDWTDVTGIPWTDIDEQGE
ncbi:hypothetical protein [Protaetiibacter larvae]|uniref:Uncharacterized protein n=1 Tax=Protaetiibacter larvae TaxID=2592654 RepID=A0A5C1Y4S5_9MICO|nr:hypothetical protein [Protaetiibacter larvae]QEO08884.1 hypothetical protein FLP23_01915 [Protaetiibacter larvae]